MTGVGSPALTVNPGTTTLDSIADSTAGDGRKAVTTTQYTAVAALAAGQAANVPTPLTTVDVRNSRSSALSWHPMDGKYSVLGWWNPDEFPAVGARVPTWSDHRILPTVAQGGASPMTQATAEKQPIVAEVNGRKVLRFDGGVGVRRVMDFPAAVVSAMAGTDSGFGKVMIAIRGRNRFVTSGDHPFGILASSYAAGTGEAVVMGRLAAEPYMPANYKTSTWTGSIVQRWGSGMDEAPDEGYGGDMNTGVMIGIYGPTQQHIYWEGQMGLSAPTITGAWVPTWVQLGIDFSMATVTDVEEVLVLGWTTEPTLADLNEIRDFLNRRQTRRVIVDGGHWSCCPSGSTSAFADLINPVAVMEDLLDGRYHFINHAGKDRTVKCIDTKFDTVVAPLLRPGDVYVIIDSIMCTIDAQKMPSFEWEHPGGVYETASTTLARLAAIAAKVKALGAIPIIPTAVGWGDWCTPEFPDTYAMWNAINAGLLAAPLTYSIAAAGVPNPAADPICLDFANPLRFDPSGGENCSQEVLDVIAEYIATAIETLAPA